MKTMFISAALIALAGAASAQEAFVAQIGNRNEGANLSFNSNTYNPNTQVIYQNGNRQAALNLANGEGNEAWAYQFANTNERGRRSVQHTSLVIQEGDENTAVNVALDRQRFGPRFPGQGAVQQTLQKGDNNVAINWSEDRNLRRSFIGGTQPRPKASIKIEPLGMPGFDAQVRDTNFGTNVGFGMMGFGSGGGGVVITPMGGNS